MIISKKKFKEEISKAVKENEEKIYRQKELDERFQYLNGDIDERFRWQRENFNHLADRVYKIEKTLGMNEESEKCCNVPVSVRG